MICSACGWGAQQAPCERCGADPLLRGDLVVRLDEVLPTLPSARAWRGVELDHAWPVRVIELTLSSAALAAATARAQQLLGVNHPALPRLLSASSPDSARLRLVSEWLPGETLEQRWSGPAPEDAVLDMLEGLLAVLRTLERMGWTHGALHPGAVQLRAARQIVLLDLAAHPPAPAPFAPPEAEATPATDRYAAGAIAASLLAGVSAIPALSTLAIRPSTRALLAGLLEVDPAKRLSADDALRRLDDARAEPAVMSPPSAHAAPSKRAPAPRPRPAAPVATDSPAAPTPAPPAPRPAPVEAAARGLLLPLALGGGAALLSALLCGLLLALR